LQNIAYNLPDAFTDYKCVTKSWNHAVNAAERVEIPKKTIQTPSTIKRGVATTKMTMLLVSDQGKRRRDLFQR
jgi:hypothetical protein